jgi:hypothetical protein
MGEAVAECVLCPLDFIGKLASFVYHRSLGRKLVKAYNGVGTRKDHHMVRNRRQWIIGILFWIIFLTSIWFGISGQYAWMDKAWGVFRLGALATVSILAVVAYYRTHKRPGESRYDRGVWRLVAPFFMDDEDIERRRKLFRISG